MWLRSLYESPDPDEENRIRYAVDPERLPKVPDDSNSTKEGDFLQSGSYDDHQDQLDEQSCDQTEGLQQLAVESQARAEDFARRWPDEEQI